MPSKQDVTAVRELASRVAEIAALPIQEEKRQLWRQLNGLKPSRPMVTIDQVCWHELGMDEFYTFRCEDPELRRYEHRLRMTLFQWEYFPVDMVVEPFIRVHKAISNTGFGIKVDQDVAVTDPTNNVVGHAYHNQFLTDEDLERIKVPQVSHDEEETARRLEVAHEVFDGLLEVRADGLNPYLSLWDPISTWMSMGDLLMAIIDRPEYMHKLVGRMTDGYLSMLDQAEEQGLLCGPQSLIHCTGAHTDELPAEGYDPEKPRTKDLWMFGLAQPLGSVSPAMYDEFEIEYAKRICERFGLVYYGCCEPLHGKMDQVRRLPNVRKISMSPWVDEEKGAEEIGSNYVYSRKPNPALLAGTSFDGEGIRKYLTTTRDICAKYGCPLELIQKDISTVCRKPERLFEWAKVAMEVVGG